MTENLISLGLNANKVGQSSQGDNPTDQCLYKVNQDCPTLSSCFVAPESLLASMYLAIACLDVVQTVAIYEEMSPELVQRLKKECLTPSQGEWLDAVIERWEKWKVASTTMYRAKLQEKK